MPPKKSPAKKASAAKKTGPAMKKPAVKKPAAKTPQKEDIPTEPYDLSFDSDGEPVDSDDDDEEERPPQAANVFRGNAFRCELQERGHEVRCGYQKANAVYDLVVGKAGGTVLLDAGVNETKANCIIVGAKGKPITAQDFAKACGKMGKLKEEHDGKTYMLPGVEIFPPASGYYGTHRGQGVEWVVKVSYDS